MKDILWEAFSHFINAGGSQILKFRETLHMNPELSCCEKSTRDYILSQIPEKEFISVHKCEDAYGFWVDIIFERTNECGVAAFRADIDALPVQEETGLSFASKNAGVMHACGHDVHTAMTLGALGATVYNYDLVKKHIKKSALRFIFQDAEEKAPGGALKLIEKNVMKNVDMIFGMHVMPHIASGSLGIRDGGIMAGGDRLNVTLSGCGGHASKPEDACDLILLAGEIITSAQRIVSRTISSLDSAVLSFCEINAGTASNILPSSLSLSASLRSLNPKVLEKLRSGVENIIRSRCEEFGAAAKILWTKGYPPLINAPEAVRKFISAARRVLGEKNIIYPDLPIMGGDDFARYAQICPAAMAFLGVGVAGKDTYPLHHPKFDVAGNDILNGTRVLAAIISEFAE